MSLEPFVDVVVGGAGPTLFLGSSDAGFFSWVDRDESMVGEHFGGSWVGTDDPGSTDVHLPLA